MDDTIIDVLRHEARISFSEIGRRVGLSTNAIVARVRRLEEAGVILGYTVVLAADRVDTSAGLEAFIDVRLDPAYDSEEFLAWTARAPEIGDAVHVTGTYDYLVHARVRDTASLDRLLRRLKKEGGATHTQTRLALR